MKLFISVVNHNHDTIITNSTTLIDLASCYNVIIKSNTAPDNKLIEYCNKAGIHLIIGNHYKGFGSNNNEVFTYAHSHLHMKDEDYFLVLNPDILIERESVAKLLELAIEYDVDISAINLYKDEAKTEYDNSIRHYHSLFNPLKSLIGIRRDDIYDKSNIKEPITIDWAAGSFLLFKTKCYESLKGFDEKYFMYFEDVDICTRANKKGNTIMYFPQVEAIHLAALNNRKLFSKHFKWYLTSLLRYHFYS